MSEPDWYRVAKEKGLIVSERPVAQVVAIVPVPDPDGPEKEFQAAVDRLAESLGWLVFHPYDSRKSQEGYPDNTMVRERLVFAELKSATGVLSPDQEMWRDRLLAAGQEWHLWRPADWEQIKAVLR